MLQRWLHNSRNPYDSAAFDHVRIPSGLLGSENASHGLIPLFPSDDSTSGYATCLAATNNLFASKVRPQIPNEYEPSLCSDLSL